MNVREELRALDAQLPPEAEAPEIEDPEWFLVAYLRVIAYLLADDAPEHVDE